MKKYLIIPIILLFVAGCSFVPVETIVTDNTLEANIYGVNVLALTGLSPANGSALTDMDPDENDIQRVIYLTFNKFLTDAAVSTTTFVLTEENNAADIRDLAIEYQKEFNRVKISATFDNDGAYMLRLVADGIDGENGDFLDGNGNGINDGSPYDDILIDYYTGTGWQDWQDYTNPELVDFGPTWGHVATTSTFGIWVSFDEYMDSASVVNNINLTDESGSSQSNDTLTWMSGDREDFWFQIDDVNDFAMFYVTLTCANITDTSDNVMIPYNMDYVTDDPEDFTFYFMTADDDPTEDDDPLRVTGVNVTDDYVEIFFNDTLDVSTVNNDNILVYYLPDGSTDKYIPGDIIIGDYGTSCLYSLTNYDNSNGYTIKVIVKKEVKDDNDQMLDTNGNNIGGEDYDPYRKGYTSTDDFLGYY